MSLALCVLFSLINGLMVWLLLPRIKRYWAKRLEMGWERDMERHRKEILAKHSRASAFDRVAEFIPEDDDEWARAHYVEGQRHELIRRAVARARGKES